MDEPAADGSCYVLYQQTMEGHNYARAESIAGFGV